MNEIDTLEKEACCGTCKYLDKEYGICRHPIAIRDDVGEKDSCNLWWGRDYKAESYRQDTGKLTD